MAALRKRIATRRVVCLLARPQGRTSGPASEADGYAGAGLERSAAEKVEELARTR